MRSMRLALPAILTTIALCGQICHAGCKVDYACSYAVRSTPLHPATLGEAMDAQRATDEACRDYRACVKEEANGLSSPEAKAAPATSVNPNLNPTVREFWRKQAEKEAGRRSE
jgi:hypothetical protein